MASPSDSISMALFCDFENVALGVRDAQYEKFDIKPILERLLLKGSIVVKKAYCDWERYKGFKATMHEANFELIEIPHVRQSGKNSADIRLVVDALDLCYTKSHVNTFVIISGDSDFSPLVSKLRENNKQVIGVGVKQSTSDLLIANCDEFIFYDDLVRENQRAQARRQSPGSNPAPAPRRSPEEERSRKESQDARRTQGVELAAETFEALLLERGDTGKIWASVLKEAIKRRKPDFSEGRYGFRTFGNLLEEAQARGLLEFGRDEKSGAYVYRSHGGPTAVAAPARPEGAGERPSERTSQGGATRHDFHAVATAPDLRSDNGEGPGPSSRNRGRRGEGSDRADRAETRPAQRNEHFEAEEADAPVERPASRYFSQPVAPEPVIDTTPQQELRADVEEGENTLESGASTEADSPEASTPRRSRARSGDGAKAGASPRKAAAPRARGARAGGDAGDAANAESPAAAPEASAAEAEGAAPAKAPVARPRSRARKPAAKPAE
ncbi:NYN domain protein [Acidovorax sp. GW101-3H11]|uniref:NYN domain-containing protein n=1 Tax=unclassified Acidovorax TaxID=2684926 RepID=UPI0007B51EA0|nr:MULTISPECIES: NYN domain-containing protein [unclassified Acidovorax]KZT14513.1 NYN domain protein [Acidovorax sp. GW101-3H11]MBW8465815.1 NYN domain-containing protein [Acidovorax sp.]